MRQRQLSIAKISRPKITGVYERKRLFKLLDQGLERPVVWISASAGSGKTTLVASYLDARKLPCLWYQLDAGDADPATFFYYLGRAAQKAAPRNKKPLPLLTPEYLASVRVFSRRYFENLCSRLKTPFVLVFDNYHEAAQDSTLHEIFIEGLSALPEGIRVVVISRTDPPQQFASLQAGNRLHVIGGEELRLTVEESKGVVRAAGGRLLPQEVVGRIHEMAYGWAAGLIIMTKGALTEKDLSAGEMEKRTPQEVFDYFASELFESAEQRLREFLLKTAFLPKITVAAAQGLTGLREADRILARLYRRNYFTEKRYQPELVYQYHPLFRDYLMARARQEYGQVELAHLKVLAADFLETTGQIEDAADLFIAVHDWNGLSRLIIRYAPAVISQGRSHTVGDWLRAIPEELLNNDPLLQYWLGICIMPMDPAKARGVLERSFFLFNGQGGREGALRSWSAVVESFPYEWNDFTALDTWIAWFDENVGFSYRYPDVFLEAQVTLSVVTALMIRQPHHPDLSQWTERAMAVARKSEDANFRIRAYAILMNYHTWKGETTSSRLLMGEIQQAAKAPDATPLTILTWRAMEVGTHGLVLAEPEQALRLIDASLAYAGQTGVHVWDHMLLAIGVNCSVMLENEATAGEFLDRLGASLSPLRRHGYCHYYYLIAWRHVLRNEDEQALTYGEQALRIAEETGYLFPLILCELEMAHIQFRRKDGKASGGHLARARNLSGKVGSSIFLYMSLLTEAFFALKTGRQAAGLKALREAMRIGSEKGYVTPLWWWDASFFSFLCTRALEEMIEVEYVRGLIRKQGLFPEGKEETFETWPWPYRISTMGTFRIMKDDKPLNMPAKTPKKPLELLKVLIAFGGTDVSEQRITDVLWPDNAGDAAHSAFTTTLQRLRQLLGNEKVIVVQDGRVSLDPRSVWVDAWVFELMLESSAFGVRSSELNSKKRFPVHDPQSELQQRLEKALQHYTGHFLSGDGDRPWAISMRERLRSKYLRTVIMLGKTHEQAGKYAKAVEVYQQGLDVDALAEEFYQRLMECHHRMGCAAEALRVYECCRRVLKASLGVEPGHETKKIAERGVGSGRGKGRTEETV